MRRLVPLLAAVLASLAAPAWAVREWHDHYREAVEKHIPSKRYQEGLEALKEAIRLKPSSGLNEQTYGLEFVDYLPYLQQAICYFNLGDYNSAQRLLNIEEAQGAIKRSTSAYRLLVQLRTQAQDAESQRLARLARAEVDRLMREATDLEKAKKPAEALARLAQAQKAAASLDAQTQKAITDTRDRIRAAEAAAQEAASRTHRIEQALGEGLKLLEEGRPSEAGVRLDEVLVLDPQNARALDAKRTAQEQILASRTKAGLDEAFRQGRDLFTSQRYEEALPPLTVAAADPANAPAREMLEKARETLERMRTQKELRARIEELLAEGERLLAQRQYPQAQVKLESVLGLDPTNARARERLTVAETRTGEEILARLLPNQEPMLTFFEPQAHAVEGPTVAVVGVATDDRGIARVEFRLGERVVAEQVPPPQDSGEATRNERFVREFPLEPGENLLVVTAVDSSGATRSERFHLTRRLRFYETRLFLPAALAGALGLVGAGLAVQRVRRRKAVRSRFNPYIAGAPVMDDDMFFGRQKLLARILNVLHHNSLMITGERRIGKTTFLFHLKKALAADEGTEYRFFPVSTDLQGVPESAFFHALMGDVVEQLDLPPATLQALRFRAGDDRYDGRDFSHDLQRVIEELKTRTDRKVKLALLIDEVDVLNEYSERVNQRLRSIFMKTFSEHLVAIMSGVGIKRVWKSEGSPWYNFFDEVELAAFSREEAEALVREPVEGIFRYEPEAVEEILAVSGQKPYVIQKLCIHSVNRMLEEGRTVVTVADVEAARRAMPRDPEAVPGPLPEERPEAPA